MSSNDSHIKLRGVKQNNLKGFDLDIPLGKLIVVTGLSGTGKSSLVFETLHAEGQRRYVETFSPYTRQFLELLSQPDVESIENIRPSIAIRQSNTVKTSRSTVGTMTELCDYFKVWFGHVAKLYDPETGDLIEEDNPESIWKKARKQWADKTVLLSFKVTKPEKIKWEQILQSISKQGYTRLLIDSKIVRIEDALKQKSKATECYVIQDRIGLNTKNKSRFINSVETALRYGKGKIYIRNDKGRDLGSFTEGLHSEVSDREFMRPSPGLFSFNSPVGACPECRGFGRVIEIDYRLVIPDSNLSINEGAIKPFRGEVYQECLDDLRKFAPKFKIPLDKPWKKLTKKQKDFVISGEKNYGEDGNEWPNAWYGVKGFFNWMEGKLYKMHIRVFLSKYRAYNTCHSCGGARLQAEALNWKWNGYTLPELYLLPVSNLLQMLVSKSTATNKSKKQALSDPVELAHNAILSRLNFLDQVGLGYLTLDRASKTLSGGEVERVNLTACLGSSLVETLFILDEPSVGLHSSDINRLIAILKQLTDQGNTVVVVEHDESVMRAADHIIELGPKSGSAGGEIIYSGPYKNFEKNKKSVTASYLSGRTDIALPDNRSEVSLPVFGPSKRAGKAKLKQGHKLLSIRGVQKNNIESLDIDIPLERLVCLSGVSGSGKSTLLDNAIYQGYKHTKGLSAEDPANFTHYTSDIDFSEVVLVDQSPVTKTPRSNPALYADAWDPIRELFAQTEEAKSAGLTASHFSFNSGNGRCDHCQGLGYEKIEMQFLSDVFVPCPECEGEKFKPEVLKIKWNDKSVSDILKMDIKSCMEFFSEKSKIVSRLSFLSDVGLSYLKAGQPLNTLSGGESQRLKLVKYLNRLGNEEKQSLILLDEPTTGLHRNDIVSLLDVLRKLIAMKHSIIVIEHQLDVIKSADWLIELGPGAGNEGGKLIAQGRPEDIASMKTPSSIFVQEVLSSGKKKKTYAQKTALPKAAESKAIYKVKKKKSDENAIEILGAREHNLKGFDVSIPRNELAVITGVSGSGKSSLAFDLIFAEGQRRFMESISSYARQFVEQLPRPDIDSISGIAPTVAIEQRVTHGTRKSTVATITEAAQYLRLLYARVGIQHSPINGQPVVSLTKNALKKLFTDNVKRGSKKKHFYLCAPIVRNRKGHHQPIADWAAAQGYSHMRCDGKIVEVSKFNKLDRYSEHDVEVIIEDFGKKSGGKVSSAVLDKALKVGKGSCFLLEPDSDSLTWLSTERADPVTGEAYPELDPKHFSWNSPKGWCPDCNGYGYVVDEADEGSEDDEETIELCQTCNGDRLNTISSHVKLPLKSGKLVSLPELLKMTPSEVLSTLKKLKLDARTKIITQDILSQIKERLSFMDEVGLNYLTLDRSTATLSGGEAQRIRLAAQLGSNLSGVIYILDEPSIGLHARDNEKLIKTLKELKAKGNSLLVVEHDEETMKAADRIIDLGPRAGVHGGEVICNGPYKEVVKNKESLTAKFLKNGIKHPIEGNYRKLPAKWKSGDKNDPNWIVMRKCSLRNLKGQNLMIPTARLTIVCGISGSGKSTLIRDLLKPTLQQLSKKKQSHATGESMAKHLNLRGTESLGEKKPFADLFCKQIFSQIIEVDQKPIGKTPRSCPATYIGAFDIIRKHFAELPDAKVNGHTASTFSFNTKGGRCEQCGGAGRINLKMNFMPDTYVKCESCNGSRYSDELDSIQWNGKSISDVLSMSFEEAEEFFSFHQRLSAMMKLMNDAGLGYLTLGQSSPTLSGGEAQRLKLVSELAKGLPTLNQKKFNRKVQNLYILEEPTIGLHHSDCERLIHVFHRLVDQGHSVIVIEHHTDVIKEADYLIEIGPEGGESGGEILYQGPLSGIQKCKKSRTAPYLK